MWLASPHLSVVYLMVGVFFLFQVHTHNVVAVAWRGRPGVLVKPTQLIWGHQLWKCTLCCSIQVWRNNAHCSSFLFGPSGAGFDTASARRSVVDDWWCGAVFNHPGKHQTGKAQKCTSPPFSHIHCRVFCNMAAVFAVWRQDGRLSGRDRRQPLDWSPLLLCLALLEFASALHRFSLSPSRRQGGSPVGLSLSWQQGAPWFTFVCCHWNFTVCTLYILFSFVHLIQFWYFSFWFFFC